MNDFLKGQIEAYCYMVEKGKPAAILPVQSRYLKEATELVDTYGLNSYAEDSSENWYELWVYKYPHTLEIIKSLQQVSSDILKHWILGKLFGYSEEAIREFLTSERAKHNKCSKKGAEQVSKTLKQQVQGLEGQVSRLENTIQSKKTRSWS